MFTYYLLVIKKRNYVDVLSVGYSKNIIMLTYYLLAIQKHNYVDVLSVGFSKT